MPAGRPEIEIDLAKVESLAATGLTEEQIARCLGISLTTLASRKRKYPHFLAAIKNGKAKGLATVTNALMKQVQAGNTSATIFYLKNRDHAQWRDKFKDDDHAPPPTQIIVETGIPSDDSDKG